MILKIAINWTFHSIMSKKQIVFMNSSKSPRKTNIPLSIATKSSTKKNQSIQCDLKKTHLEDADLDNYLTDDIIDHYKKSICFINNYHKLLNEQLEEKFGYTDHKSIPFQIPEIQNHLSIFLYLKSINDDPDVKPTVIKDESNNEGSCLKNLVEKLSNTSMIEFVPEIKQLKEYKEFEKKMSHNQCGDSGFNSKESSNDMVEMKTENENTPAENQTSFLQTNKYADMFIHPLHRNQLKAEDNRKVIEDMVKEQMSCYMTQHSRKLRKKLSKTVITQIDIPAYKMKSNNHKMSREKMISKCQLECIRQSLLDDDNSTIIDDEEFEKLTHCSVIDSNEDSQSVHIPILGNIKGHPFNLNKKDIPLINKDVLTAIGIFTEKGEIKPDVLERLHKEKQQNSTNSKNKIFREKRHLDYGKLYNTPEENTHSTSLASTSVSSIKSDSSDIKSDSEMDLIDLNRKPVNTFR